MLEVITEAEVAEHLEETQVARIATHLFEITVLASGAHAFLHGGGSGERRELLTEEVGLERHHAGHGEQQVGVVRDETRGRDDGVTALLEEPEEGATELIGSSRTHGADSLTSAVGGRIRPSDEA